MPIPKTKLRPPNLRQPIVPRPRLTSSFANRRPLTIVSAPAGSGKTTLALEWLASSKTRGAWLALDNDDNDPIRFINGVIAALQVAGMKLRAPSGQRDVKNILTDIINQFDGTDAVTLVLDDYHLIFDEAIHAAMEYLLEHIPPTLHIVIVTRETPPLPLARLRARDQLREFHLDELRFTSEEARLFLNQVMGLKLSDRQLDNLAQHTQGWVAGLQMAGLSLQADASQPIPNPNERQFVTDYFLTEVFNRQPKDVQTFLLNTSVLEKFSAAQCKSVFAGNAGKILAHLEKSNLFISAVDKRHQYHPLFREFLQAKLQSAYPERVVDLHRKSFHWLEQNGFAVEAIPHAFAIADDESAARLIATLAPDFLKRGELVALRRWLDRLPESTIWRFPRLCLTQIWLLLDSNLQNDAQSYFDRLGNYLEKNMRSEFLVLRALHAAMTHQPEEAMKFMRKAQRTKEAKDPFIQTYVSFGLGAAQKMALQLFQAEQSFRSSLALAEAEGNAFISLSAFANLVDVLYLQARLADAESACKEALRNYRQNIPEASDWYWTLSRIAFQKNQLKEALDCANRAIDLCIETNQAVIQARVLLQRAQIHRAMNSREKAQADLDAADTLARGLQDNNVLRSIIRQRVQFALQEGDLDSARQWLQTLKKYGETPYPYYFSLIKGKTLLAANALHEAHAEFAKTLKLLSGLEFTIFRIEALIWHSACLSQLNQKQRATKALNEAVKLAQAGGVVRPFVEARKQIADILPRLNQVGFIRKVEQAGGNASQAQGPGLTRREKEILQLLAIGLSNQELAERLFIAEGTLKRHVANLYQKLGVHNRAQAIQHFHQSQ